MNQQEEFEKLKEGALKSYAEYMKKIEQASFKDIDNFETWKSLIEAFSQSVTTNTAYRDFISKYWSIKNARK